MRRSFLIGAFAVAILTACPGGLAFGAVRTFDNGWRIDRWTVADGLPHNKVESIVQDSREAYLWVGTHSGLVRFDGIRFVTPDAFKPLEVSRAAVPALVLDKRDGSLWGGTTFGLFHMQGQKVAWFGPTNGLPHRKVWELLPRASGDLWIHTEAGFCVYSGGEFRKLGEESGLTNVVRCWLETDRGEVWIGNESSHRRFDAASGKFLPTLVWKFRDDLPIRSMALSRSGEALLGTEIGLYRLYNNRNREFWERYGVEEGLADPWIHFVHEDSRGRLWVITKSGGLYLLNGNRFTHIDLGISNDEFAVDKICGDREGNLWIATREGLIRLQWQPVKTLTTADGLLDNRVTTAYAGPDGTVWLGSSLGLNWIDSTGHIGTYRREFPLPQSNIRGLCVDDAGALWVGSFGLFRLTNGGLESFRVGNVNVQSIYKDSSGAMWIGCSERGIVRFSRGVETWFTTADGLGSNGADVFLEDRSGNFWIGNGAGLHLLRNGKVIRFSENEGLFGGAHASLGDGDGSLWVGNDLGLFRYASNRFSHIGLTNGLPELPVHQILQDEDGYIWLSGDRGLHRASRTELVAVCEGWQTAAHFISLDEADGMLSGETSGGISPAGCRAPDGRLWFPTIHGVAVVDPRIVKLNELPPPVVIEQVKAGDQTIFGDGCGVETDGSTATRVKSGRVLVIYYTANSFTAPEKVRFQYRLEPRDKEWVDAADRRYVFFDDLRAGSYRFHVKACNSQGIWNEARAPFAFEIEPRFSETPTFYVSVGTLVAIVAFLVHRARLSHARHIQSLEHQLAFEHERSRIAEDIHDDVGASLTRIQLLSQVVEEGASNETSRAAKVHAQEIAVTAQSIVQRMDEIVWAVNPRYDTLASFVDYVCHAAQEMFQGTRISCRFDVANTFPEYRLTSETRHDLYLLLKEALHNVLKHSLGTEATLRLREERGKLELEIEDNGCGLDSAKDVPGGNGGDGLWNMRERTKKLGGVCVIRSTPGKGTKVRFEIPLQ